MRKAAWACLSFSAGIFLSRYLLPTDLFLWAVGVFAAVGAAGFFFRGNTRLRLCLLGFGLSVGVLCFFAQTHLVIERAETLAEKTVSVSARVTSYADVYEDSEYIELRLTDETAPRVRCRAMSYTTGSLSQLRPGDEIKVTLRLRSASVRNGEEVDTYHAKGIFLRGSLREEPTVTGRWRFSFLYAPKTLSRSISTLCDRVFPTDASPFMKALLIGDRQPFFNDGQHYYPLKEAGLSHVIAISGMHISFLTGVIFLLFGKRRGVLWICAPLLLLFAAMTGFTPSVTRAVFMQLCLLTAPMVRREGDPVTALSVALAVLLLFNPSACASLSLQLSFGAMGGITLISERLYHAMRDWCEARRLSRFRLLRRLLFGIAGNAAGSIGALFLTVPLCALHFGTVSLLAPLSNLLCLWMISLVYVGGFVAVILGAIFPPMGALAGGLIVWGVRYLYGITGFLYRFPWETLYTRGTVYGWWLLWVYLLFLAAWLLAKRARLSTRPILPLCLSVCLLCVCLLTEKGNAEEPFAVTALDVEQGACTVLTSGDHTVVVDCGGSWVTGKAGETATYFLCRQGRRQVDALVLTHLHSDHVNGARELLSRCRVETLYLPKDEESIHYPEILSAAQAAGTEIVFVTDSLRVTAGEMQLTLLSPLKQIDGDNPNEMSLFVLAGQGDTDVVITGDAYALQEKAALRRMDWPDIEILVVGHHGSDTSTCPEFLEALRPDAAVISVGYNEYGHPSEEILSRLYGYGIDVYRTDEQGTVTLTARKE